MRWCDEGELDCDALRIDLLNDISILSLLSAFEAAEPLGQHLVNVFWSGP